MKQKYTVEVADIQYTLLSDDSEDFVKSVVSVVDERIREMILKNKRCSKLDAAVLCAIDYCGANMQAQKRIKNLEAQVALYAANVERLRDECDILSGRKAANPADDRAEADDATEAPEDATEIDAGESAAPAEEEASETSAWDMPADESADKAPDDDADKGADESNDEIESESEGAAAKTPAQDDVRRRLDDFRNELKSRREG